MKSAFYVVVAVVLGMAQCSGAEIYSTDLTDVRGDWGSGSGVGVRAIGDVAAVEKILDIRGFVPMSFPSKSKTDKKVANGLLLNMFTDVGQYYQCPTRETLSKCHFDPKAGKSLKNAVYVKEKDVSEDDLKWVKIAYGLTRGQGGKSLYESLIGSTGYVDATPIAVTLTDSSAFIWINFRWSNASRNDATGQTLCAFEISRRLLELKQVHRVRDLSEFSKQSVDSATAATPIVLQIISTITTGK